MKKDLKDIVIASAIYVGLVLGGVLVFLPLWWLQKNIPGFDNIFILVGVVYYAILAVYLSIRRWKKRKEQKQG